MATLDRGNDGRFTRSEAHAETDAKAVRLRAQGASYSAIGKALGYSDASGAFRAVQRGLAAVVAPDVRELRLLQGEELDQVQRECWKIIAAPHLKSSNSGRVVLDPATQEPLLDPAPTIAALNTLLKVSARRAALFGLDAPTSLRVEHAGDAMETYNAAYEALMAELDRQIAAEGRTELPPGHPG